MLRRKEILLVLKKCGFYKLSELKTGCRDYENYSRSVLKNLSAENRKASARS